MDFNDTRSGSGSAQYTLSSLTVTIKGGEFALKQHVFVFESNRGKPQHSRDQRWRLEAKANSAIHPERLDVRFFGLFHAAAVV